MTDAHLPLLILETHIVTSSTTVTFPAVELHRPLAGLYRAAKRYTICQRQFVGGISTVHPPSEWFRSGTGDRFVFVSANSRVRLPAQCFLPISDLKQQQFEMHRFCAENMGQTERQTDGRILPLLSGRLRAANNDTASLPGQGRVWYDHLVHSR